MIGVKHLLVTCMLNTVRTEAILGLTFKVLMICVSLTGAHGTM